MNFRNDKSINLILARHMLSCTHTQTLDNFHPYFLQVTAMFNKYIFEIYCVSLESIHMSKSAYQNIKNIF